MAILAWCTPFSSVAPKEPRSIERAVAVLKPLAERSPEVLVYATSLAGTYTNWGNLLKDTGKPADALAILNLAVNLGEKLFAQGTQVRLSPVATAYAHAARAQAHENLKHWQDAINDWDRVIAVDSGFSKQVWHVNRAILLGRAGEFKQAAKEAEILVQDPDLTDEIRYALLCVYGLALKSDPKSIAGDHYVGRALAMFQKLKANGYFRKPAEAGLLSTDDDLSALRERSEFRQLLKEVEAKK